MYKIFTLILFLSLLFCYLNFYKRENEVHFLDIGQGDAILIELASGQNILIDGGPDNLLLARLGQYLPWWERQIDYLVISHFHADHMMGFLELLNKYKVKNILVSDHKPDDFLYKMWLEKVKENNINLSIVSAGEKFIVNKNVYWQVLSADSYHEDYNQNSVVIKMTINTDNFLLMGDLPSEGEERLLEGDFDLQAKYLKVGHHGSKYSSSAEFLQVVSPEFCIIQSGQDNKFGHPHQETIGRLKDINCEIVDNQYLGTISFEID